MLDIMEPAELLKAYVRIANSVTQFSDLAKVWQFDSNTPRDLKYLAWRAKANSSNEHGHAATGSSGLRGPDERSRKRPRSEGQASRPPSSERQQQAGGGDYCDGGGGDGVNVSGADDNVCMDEMDVSGSEAESEEFAASDERMENDRGRETAMIWSGSPYKIPYYTASELICTAAFDEENDKATSQARECMRAQQGEIPPGFVVRRYLDSLQTDGGVLLSVDGV